MNIYPREISRTLFPRLNCHSFLVDHSYAEQILALVRAGVGGFVLFEGHVDEVARTVEMLRAQDPPYPLLFAADCEFGLSMRFEGGIDYPDMWAWGSADDPELTRRAARAIGLEMRRYGIDWNFAPVVDVNTNPANPIVNVRAFGEDPERVAVHGAAYVQGLQGSGVIACAKHFPGHGDTEVDSHIGLPALPFDRERLDTIELLPFRSALHAGALSVMTAHLAVPALDPTGDPTSLSGPIVTGLLREELGFEGVAVTDALDMGAIVERFGTEEAVVRAFLAGNDVLEIPDDPFRALEGLQRAVENDRISREQIALSLCRIDRLLEFSREEQGTLLVSEDEGGEDLAATIARNSIVVEGEFSLQDMTEEPPVVLILRDERAERSAAHLQAILEKMPGARVWNIQVATSSDDTRSVASIKTAVETARHLILVLMIRPRGGAGSVSVGDEGESILLSADPSRTVVLNFGNPYLLGDFSAVCRVDAFSASVPSVDAVLALLKIKR